MSVFRSYKPVFGFYDGMIIDDDKRRSLNCGSDHAHCEYTMVLPSNDPGHKLGIGLARHEIHEFSSGG